MAGLHFSGIDYSRAELFEGAAMVLVPPPDADMSLTDRVIELLAPAKFGRFTVCTADEHDKMIAYTSQLAHVVSNAYVKSPTARMHHGFSAGSYKDLTRVAKLDENMWTELFLQNAEYLSDELGFMINSLKEYKAAIDANDAKALKHLLKEGRIIKEETDGYVT
jgi:prephenate dehydrogenase